jgi:phage terminase small subunit
VEHYTSDCAGNISRAYIAAGYRAGGVQNAGRLLKNPKVLKAIEKVMAPSVEKAGVSRDELVQKLAERFRDPNVLNTDLVRIGKLLAEMTPGALVPVGVKVTGMTLEDFIAMGASNGGITPVSAVEGSVEGEAGGSKDAGAGDTH